MWKTIIKVLILSVLLTAAMILPTGCSVRFDNSSLKDVDNFELTGDVTFVPVSSQHIDDKSVNGIYFYEYVDLSTGVMYVYTSKFRDGYATTWSPLYNSNGTLKVCENLEFLRKVYNWEETNEKD